MKYLKCPVCKRDAWVSDDCRLSLCPICMVEQVEVKELEELRDDLGR